LHPFTCLMTMDNPIYLGDAVYAYFDGKGIELRLNAHESQCVVYLEPDVLTNLIEFAAGRRVMSWRLGGIFKKSVG
jgi:hypothetical protein